MKLSSCAKCCCIVLFMSVSGLVSMRFLTELRLSFRQLLLAGLHIAVATPALADDPSTDGKSGFVVTLGGNVEYAPSYPGSSHQSLGAIPSFDIRRMDEPDENSAPDDNIDYSLFDAENFEAGPVLGFRDRRSVVDDERLGGLRKIEWSPDFGIFAQHWLVPDKLRLRTEVRQALFNESGIVADFGADWYMQLTDDLTISVGPRLSAGSSRYMKTYFSVSDAEAASNGAVTAFQASGGLQSAGLTIAASYQVTPTITMGVYNRFDRLLGDAADSSITQAFGRENQNTIGVSLTKSFQVSF